MLGVCFQSSCSDFFFFFSFLSEALQCARARTHTHTHTHTHTQHTSQFLWYIIWWNHIMSYQINLTAQQPFSLLPANSVYMAIFSSCSCYYYTSAVCFCSVLFASGAEYSMFLVFAKMVFKKFSVPGNTMLDSKLFQFKCKLQDITVFCIY